ncbi:hypothetical protein CWI38_0846p0030 [Hamiltosporidium tvaerminnensis]|uniref:Uncharacterized protein n=1 Tax=Hamiltosporidium tvaerminnensis TaxID=1176355 RepID=A0A4Q9LUA3_9MICR|nr:hypothetical protein CWI38_0846p0030 [Hamiltosporidium tvaerminnensis]
MSWDRIVTEYHKMYVKRLEIPMNVEAYIQSIVHKKTVDTISFSQEEHWTFRLNAEESWGKAPIMHEEPTPPLKEAKRNEDGAKSDLEEETKVVKESLVQEILENECAEIRGGIQNNRHEIFILDKNDRLANKLGLIYKCSIKIIPYCANTYGIKGMRSVDRLKKTVKKISKSVLMSSIKSGQKQEETIHSLKQAINEEDNVKN